VAKFFDYLKKLALVFWLGEMLFFAFVFAPRVFKILPRPQAADLQAALFPPYFAIGVICSIVILISILGSQFFSGTGFFSKSERLSYQPDRVKVLPLILPLICGCIFAYCLLSLTPKITKLQSTLYSQSYAQNMEQSTEQNTEQNTIQNTVPEQSTPAANGSSRDTTQNAPHNPDKMPDDLKERFDFLHKFSTALNVVVLVSLLIFLAIL